MSATVEFAKFSIDSQFYGGSNSPSYLVFVVSVHLLAVYAPQGNAAVGANGLIGLGPNFGSVVRVLGNTTAADPPLYRIFNSNDSVSPLIAILLQHSDDPDEPYPGDLAIGEVLPDYQDILNQPQLPAVFGEHWQTLLDVNGIIGPNGQPIEIQTQVTNATTQNATIVFDTGFTMSQVPP